MKNKERKNSMDFSIVIPTWNRSELVDALLKSLYDERSRYKLGNTEVLIVDSSIDAEKENIVLSCEKYDAVYIEGDNSVRKKGIRVSNHQNMTIFSLLIRM